MKRVSFEETDFADGLPAAGRYPGTIRSARLRRSSRGNIMVELVVALDTEAGSAEATDYFVLEGVAPRGLAVARHRLVELYRASGLDPHGGDEIQPEVLVGAALEVRIRHQERDGEVRLQVVGYRAIPRPVGDSVPF